MPSTLIGNPVASGPQIVYSGNIWSGNTANRVIGSVQFKLADSASGNVYLGFSSNITLNSGGFLLSGGGLNDGFVLFPGDTFTVPKLVLLSGQLNVYARHDVACSGQARLYWHTF